MPPAVEADPGGQPAPCLLWSKRQSEFGERGSEPAMRIGVGGEFEVAAAKVLDEGVPGADHLSGAEAFETSQS